MLCSSKKPRNGKEGREEQTPSGPGKRRPDHPKKIKLRDHRLIPVPRTAYEDDSEIEDLGEEDFDMKGLGSFVAGVDKNALSRSVKETKRLHALSKAQDPPPQRVKAKERLPSPGSDRSTDYDMDSNADFDSYLDDLSEIEVDDHELSDSDLEGIEESDELDNLELDENDEGTEGEEDDEDIRGPRKRKPQDKEEDYELIGRQRWIASSPETEEDHMEVGRLPIKLPTGEVQQVEGTSRIPLPPKPKPTKKPEPVVEEVEEEEEEVSDDGAEAEKMAGQKGRFGRMGISEIVSQKEWKNSQKLDAAKEQIAQLGAQIMAGGELVDNGPLLTRLSTYALPSVPAVDEGGGERKQIPVPASIRGLALLSQLAVFKDLIPEGYRIRQLTQQEEAEKVRDEVKRLREGEKILVKCYRGYLKMLEAEVKSRSTLASLSLKCLCELLSSVPHFNFSENIMGVLVSRLGRKSWDEESTLILQTFITVFRNDITSLHSQTLVRLVARMIKERKFQVHPNVLSCLLHLRLRTELDHMRESRKELARQAKEKERKRMMSKKFKSEVRKKWQTKNEKKREKEMKETKKQMAEAEAEVDKEERAHVQTETLKNIFVLYFSILKHPGKSPLLSSALEGISQFAHFINVDFFRDLLAVLRLIVLDQPIPKAGSSSKDVSSQDDEKSEEEGTRNGSHTNETERIRTRLLAIATAFDLLSGQGEALTIDLSAFINALFSLLRSLCLDTELEDPPLSTSIISQLPHPSPDISNSHFVPDNTIRGKAASATVKGWSTSDLLFRCLESIFFSRQAPPSPPWRAAAFAKRLTECSLHFPPSTAERAIGFVRKLMARHSQLEGLLDTEERMFDGVYKPELDDPQLINTFSTSLWEVHLLAEVHMNEGVRVESKKLRDNDKT
ncbi:hypothetical protein M231_06193 [Tremella mesenterica]|uniref:Nucleolar complex-associated protein 3 n=1 Tax=Tremella mesenterica TaxID=5217 RepID=A0A4Q1BEI6_TREME|nr:hypothetical protein M231_06193 [Tremella mesenterica]